MANLNVRLPDAEKQILKDYCQKSGRTETDVIREFVRSLAKKTP